MNKDMLCTWLGVPKESWPPDAWALLGLPKGDHDPAAIEKQVQERMAKLRSYQLSFPEEATEGMNRLAEAFVTLTEARRPAPPPEKPAPTVSKDDTAVTNKAQTQVDWRAEPPPVRQETASTPELIAEDDAEAANGKVLTAKPFVAPAKPHRREIDPVQTRELAELSDEATSNLATLEAVIERVEHTRRVLHLWDQIGKQLRTTPKKTSTKEADAYAVRLDKVLGELETYPAFLGQPGLPGYRVVVQARLRMPLASVRALPTEQREELLFDWRAARAVLLAHRKYLRQVFRSLRRRTVVGLFMHAVRAVLNDHPRVTLAAVLVLGVVIAGVVFAIYR
jgi:hypothetical protein